MRRKASQTPAATARGPAVAAPGKARAALAGGVADLRELARRIYRLVACGGEDRVVPGGGTRYMADHCRSLRAYYGRHRRRVIEVARPFVAALLPARLPDRVVYPFGGGDLLFALTIFPDAREITTVSLERSGDARGIDAVTPGQLRGELQRLTWMFMRQASVDYNFTSHMRVLEGSRIPLQLTLSLMALSLNGLEPVSLRYFRLTPTGEPRYLSPDELGPAPASGGPSRSPGGRRRDGAPPVAPGGDPFGNMELAFRPIGARPGTPPVIYRHIAANLHDAHLPPGCPLLRHLESKGPVVAMTKAASYLLWRDDFSHIRSYLLTRMEWMISDSTGILPRHARAAGFVQEPFGRFRRSLLGTQLSHNQEMGALWRSRPERPLPFRFGYPDFDSRSSHLLITRRKPPP